MDGQDKQVDNEEDKSVDNTQVAEADSLEPLEQQKSVIEEPGQNTDLNTDNLPSNPAASPKDKKSRFKIRHQPRLYTAGLIVLIVLAAGMILFAYNQNKNSSTATVRSSSLSQSSLQQLANSDTTVGSNNTVLNVESSAVFAGQVLTKQSLQVAGNLQVGGSANFSSISVNGPVSLGQLNISKNLTVGGSESVQGSTTISQSLQVNGNGTFNGTVSAAQISASVLQVSGNLVVTHHLSSSGSAPNRSSGSAVGSGGSASISGNDTAGTINIDTGAGASAGCFINVTFSSSFSTTPHIILTPASSAAGTINYYVNRSTSGFSVCDATSPPAGSVITFDYFVID